jgi:predicted N-acyltransferase
MCGPAVPVADSRHDKGDSMKLRVQQHPSILDIDASAWNVIAGDSPFLRHEFLGALERSGCVGAGTTWEPTHLTVTDEAGDLAGAMPLYIKYDSRGEFVFDWSWANAYDQAGLSYYPKLVSAVPFTPATGQRLLIREHRHFSSIAEELLAAARKVAEKVDASSLHVLFPTETERSFLSSNARTVSFIGITMATTISTIFWHVSFQRSERRPEGNDVV